MPDQDTPQSRQESLTNLVNSIEAAENPEKYLINLTIERLRREDAELAEAIRYCAIPRRFDANIIGVVRGAPDDHETNERLLADLLAHSFVLAREGGDYAYHDNTRDLLLEDWQADDERAKFEVYNQRLVDFYEEHHERARDVERDLEDVASVVREANPSRYSQLASTAETLVVAPLLEALYHQLFISGQSGYDLFTRYFEEYEDKGSLTVCESLQRATREYIRLLSSEDDRERLLRWLDSYKARLMIKQRRFAESEQSLRDLLDQVGDDISLKLWVLGDLGRLFEGQSNLREALATHDRTLKLSEETQNDLYNLPVRYMSLASVYWTLGELDRAAELFREAIQRARAHNPNMEGWARVNLSGVMQDLGQLAEAFNVALEALHFARTISGDNRSLHQSVLERFMFLVHQRTPRLLDTLAAEYSGYLKVLDDPSDSLLHRIQYADFLRESGQLERAEKLVTELQREAATNDAGMSLDQSLYFTKSSLREEKGRLAEATDLYTKIIGDVQNDSMDRWDHGRALTNRGLIYTDRGLWSEALGDFRAALVQWQEIGHEMLVAYMQVLQADTLRRQGRLDEAQRLLNTARSGLGNDASTRLADFHSVQGAVYCKQGRWSEAHQKYQQALNIYRAVHDPRSVARLSGKLAATAAKQNRWREAAHHANEASEYWQRLDNSARYQPTRETEQANAKNRSGVQYSLVTGKDQHEKISQAKDLFLEASALDPQNVWYRLNLAYAHAALEEWGEAAEVVGMILEDVPEWLRVPALYERLAEYGFRRGEALLTSGDYQGAAETYAETLDRCKNRIRLGSLTMGWLGLGDSKLLLERSEGAKTAYREGLKAMEDAESIADEATFHGRLACVAAAQADLTRVLEHCRRSLQLRAQARLGGAPDMVREWFGEPEISSLDDHASLVSSVQQHGILDDALRILTHEVTADRDQRRTLISARLYISTLSPAVYATEIDAAESIPVVTPIILEADDRLFPHGKETPQVIRMLETDIPAMRDRLQTNTGVTIPGVSIRPNTAFAEGTYVLMLDEVPLSTGYVPFDKKYCPDPQGLEALGIEEHNEVRAGDETGGMWLSKHLWARVEGAGLPLEDPYQFMLSELEDLIRRHLATFLGIQEVQSLLFQWRWDAELEERSALLDAAVPDDAAQRRLVRVLKHLANEEVPVGDLTTILNTFSYANPKYVDTIEVAEDVRMALQTELPGTRGERQLVGLSSNFEEATSRWVRERNGNRFLALPREEARALLSAVSEHLAGRAARDLTLVVRRSGLRPFVRRLVASQFPLLPVLAETELVEARASITEEIQYVSRVPDIED